LFSCEFIKLFFSSVVLAFSNSFFNSSNFLLDSSIFLTAFSVSSFLSFTSFTLSLLDEPEEDSFLPVIQFQIRLKKLIIASQIRFNQSPIPSKAICFEKKLI
jgi:hypothetical protein